MSFTLTDAGREFATERHLATLSTLSADGSIHAVPVGFTLVDGLARIITFGTSQKVRNIRARRHTTISQVEGGRWLTLVGVGHIADDPDSVARAVALYAGRYRQPRPNPERVAVHIEVTRMMGSAGLVARD